MTTITKPKARRRRCDNCGHRRVIVMGAQIIDREIRADLGRDYYSWCLACARHRHPRFTPQRKPTTEQRRPWFES